MSWTVSVTVVNQTDRTLKRESGGAYWGEVSSFPSEIPAGGVGTFTVVSPTGKPYGVEFGFTLRDVAPTGKTNYGTCCYHVDVPLCSSNSSTLTMAGVLDSVGYRQIPAHAHDYTTVFTIYSKANTNDLELAEDEEKSFVVGNDSRPLYRPQYDWDTISLLPLKELEDIDIRNEMPDIFKTYDKMIGRTGEKEIEKAEWKLIRDRKFTDEYSQLNFVRRYFTVSVFRIRNNYSVNIPSNSTYTKDVTLSHRSTIRRETSTEFRMENSFTLSGDVGAELRTTYQIVNLEEYCDENEKTEVITTNYESMDVDRDVVFWDMDKILMLYREDINNNIELLGIDDYFVESSVKTYLAGGSKETSSDENEVILGNTCGIFKVGSNNYAWNYIAAVGSKPSSITISEGTRPNPGNWALYQIYNMTDDKNYKTKVVDPLVHALKQHPDYLKQFHRNMKSSYSFPGSIRLRKVN